MQICVYKYVDMYIYIYILYFYLLIYSNIELFIVLFSYMYIYIYMYSFLYIYIFIYLYMYSHMAPPPGSETPSQLFRNSFATISQLFRNYFGYQVATRFVWGRHPTHAARLDIRNSCERAAKQLRKSCEGVSESGGGAIYEYIYK